MLGWLGIHKTNDDDDDDAIHLDILEEAATEPQFTKLNRTTFFFFSI